MELKEYRKLFAVACLILMLIAASPVLSMFIGIPNGSEKFSELWLLGPAHKAEGYPFNVGVNETYSVYVGAGNHLGYSAYYRVSVKFRNQTQPLPVASNTPPSPLPDLHEFDFFVRDGEVWERLMNFKIVDVHKYDNLLTVNNLSINGSTFLTNSLSSWDKTRNGFYYQLFFELWLYNMTLRSFGFHDRFVGIWLNVTG